MPEIGSGYVRLSGAATEDNLSLSGMVDEVRALADREGIHLLDVHVDEKSGGFRDRPGFQAWLTDLARDEVSVAVVHSVDRLSREGVNVLGMVLDRLEGKDPNTGRITRTPLRMVSVDGLDSVKDPESFRWQVVIRGEIGRAERGRMITRNKDNKRRLKEAGRHPGGVPVFGCRVVKRDIGDGKVGKFLEAEPEEAKVIEEIAQMLVKGKPMSVVIRWLASEGVQTRRGNPWTPKSLRGTLTSPAIRDHVLDPATWLALQKRLARETGSEGRKPSRRTGRPPTWLLPRGNGVCGRCGTTMTLTYTRGHPRYNCRGVTMGICGGITIAAEPTDAYIASEYLAVHGDLPAMELIPTWPGQEELRAATLARDKASDALSAGAKQPGADVVALATDLAAKQAEVERWEGIVKGGKISVTLSLKGRTLGEEWEMAAKEDRWHIIREAMAYPIIVNPATSQGGAIVKGTIDTSRIELAWVVEMPTPTEND